MRRDWKIVAHEPAWDFSDSLRKPDRERLRRAFLDLKTHPFTEPDEEVRLPGDRIHSVRVIHGFRIRYWLDLLVAEIIVVDVEKA